MNWHADAMSLGGGSFKICARRMDYIQNADFMYWNLSCHGTVVRMVTHCLAGNKKPTWLKQNNSVQEVWHVVHMIPVGVNELLHACVL